MRLKALQQVIDSQSERLADMQAKAQLVTEDISTGQGECTVCGRWYVRS